MNETERAQNDDIPLEPLLVRHVEPPTPRTRWIVISLLGSITLAGVGATLALQLFILASMPPRWLEPTYESTSLTPATLVAPAENGRLLGPELPPTIEPANASFAFVMEAGQRRFLILEAIEEAKPWSEGFRKNRHKPYPPGTELLGDLDYPDGALLPARVADLPPRVATWRGRTASIENNCETRVDEIVRLSLVVGSPDYAVDVPEKGDRRSVMLDYAVDYGLHYYAVELRDCASGRWGRLASSPMAHKGIEISTPSSKLVALAEADLFRSKASKAAQERWKQSGGKGRWHRAEMDQTTTKQFKHPATGEEWLLIHRLADYSCGGSEINMLGLYRVVEGEVVRHFAGDAKSTVGADQLIDSNGDGLFEILGASYLSGPVLLSNRGAPLKKVDTPFYGCPC